MVLSTAEWIVVMELRRYMVSKSRHIHHSTDMEPISRSGHRKRCPETHAHAHPRSMEIASLVMIQGICATWSGSIVARRLICEIREGE